MTQRLAVIGVALLSAAVAQEPANLVSNPGFEALTDGWPKPWSQRAPVFAVETAFARSGERCLKYTNADPERYVLCTAPIDLEPGLVYEIEAWVRTADVTGKDSGATVCLEWSDATGKFIGGCYPTGVKGTQAEWTLVSGRTPPIPAEAARCQISCYLRKGMTGTAWWDDLRVTRYLPPLLGTVIQHRYRGLVSDGAVHVFGSLSLGSHRLGPNDVDARLDVVDAAGQVVRSLQPVAVTSDQVEFRFDASNLPAGDYDLRVQVATTTGEHHAANSCPLHRVAALPERHAWFDQHQRLILAGQPFFPLGMYWTEITEPHLDLYRESAFNCLMPYNAPDRAALDAAMARGLRVIYSVKDDYAGRGGLTSEEEAYERIRQKVEQHRDHPAVLAWYINDELPLSMLEQLTAHRDWLEALDPSRPTWVVLYQYRQVRDYLPTFDCIGTDPYPIPRQPASEAGRWAQVTRDAVFGARPVWMVPQVFNWASYKPEHEKAQYRPPSLAEMRSMAWQCIAGGANGLIFYSWMDLWRMDKTVAEGGRALVRDPFDERWADIKQVAAEIAEQIPVLLSAGKPPALVSGPDPLQVGHRLYADDSFVYLLAVNATTEPTDASFQFDAPVSEPAVLLGGGLAAGDGVTVRLPLAPLEPKLVRLRRGG